MARTARQTKPSERLALPVQQERSRATRERLLAAAEKVFAEKGYEGTRISEIAETAGCSVGAVYFRFKDKDALFQAIAEDFTHNARQMMPLLMNGHTLDELVRNCVKRTALSFREHRGLFRAIVERGFEQPHLTKSIFTFRDEAAGLLENALRELGVKRRDLGLSVRVMMQMLHGFLLAATLNARAPAAIGNDLAIEELAKACIAYLEH
jgi:AcrR family transcriptional regulator